MLYYLLLSVACIDHICMGCYLGALQIVFLFARETNGDVESLSATANFYVSHLYL
jgi:hypothetical protein